MCINNHAPTLEKEKAKQGQLTLWKVIQTSNAIGIWSETFRDCKFHVGNNRASSFGGIFTDNQPGQFHCFLTRTLARWYRKHRGYCSRGTLKIIKVYADRKDIVKAGVDENTPTPCISVSKMEIKSLKHQR